MSDVTIWEPVLAPGNESSGGSGRSARGGRRSSSIIARRRPGAKKEGAEEPKAEEQPEAAAEEKKPAPKRRRRTSSTATASRAASKPAAKEADEQEPETPEIEESEEEAVDAPAAEVATAVTAAPTDGGELTRLRTLVEAQGKTLRELRAGLLTLGEQLDLSAQRPRLGVFVDVPNVMYGQEPDEKPVDMGKLLDMLRRGRDLVRATAYSPVSDDPSEPLEQQKFVAPFVPYEYRIVTKPLKRFADGSIKGNFDVEMAIDMLTMAERLDVIAIVSGDADFARAVEVVQTRGVRVEVVAFAGSTSLEMRSLADRYIELGQVVGQLT